MPWLCRQGGMPDALQKDLLVLASGAESPRVGFYSFSLPSCHDRIVSLSWCLCACLVSHWEHDTIVQHLLLLKLSVCQLMKKDPFQLSQNITSFKFVHCVFDMPSFALMIQLYAWGQQISATPKSRYELTPKIIWETDRRRWKCVTATFV